LRRFGRRRYKKMFPNEVFLSYLDPRINELIAAQPSVYIFSLRKGRSVSPWFVDESDPKHAIHGK